MRRTQTLAPEQRLLRELANLQNTPAAIGRFRTQFGQTIPDPLSGVKDEWLSINQYEVIEHDDGMTSTRPRRVTRAEYEAQRLLELRDQVRAIWNQTDLRRVQYGVFVILQRLFGDPMRPPVSMGALPPPSRFEEALVYLQTHGAAARICGDTDCPAPYFFVMRRTQQYCSEQCAQPAQRVAKRKWWAETGAKRRKRGQRSKKV